MYIEAEKLKKIAEEKEIEREEWRKRHEEEEALRELEDIRKELNIATH